MIYDIVYNMLYIFYIYNIWKEIGENVMKLPLKL